MAWQNLSTHTKKTGCHKRLAVYLRSDSDSEAAKRNPEKNRELEEENRERRMQEGQKESYTAGFHIGARIVMKSA